MSLLPCSCQGSWQTPIPRSFGPATCQSTQVIWNLEKIQVYMKTQSWRRGKKNNRAMQRLELPHFKKRNNMAKALSSPWPGSCNHVISNCSPIRFPHGIIFATWRITTSRATARKCTLPLTKFVQQHPTRESLRNFYERFAVIQCQVNGTTETSICDMAKRSINNEELSVKFAKNLLRQSTLVR
jgi:hypothetical protein